MISIDGASDKIVNTKSIFTGADNDPPSLLYEIVNPFVLSSAALVTPPSELSPSNVVILSGSMEAAYTVVPPADHESVRTSTTIATISDTIQYVFFTLVIIKTYFLGKCSFTRFNTSRKFSCAAFPSIGNLFCAAERSGTSLNCSSVSCVSSVTSSFPTATTR